MKASYKYGSHVIAKANASEAEARAEMKKQVGTWPIKRSDQTNQEYYDDVVRYGAQESAIIAEKLKQPLGGERPLVVDNTNQRRENWYDK